MTRKAPWIVAVLAVVLSIGIAAPAHADDYPSWDEVQAAKSSADAAQAEYDKISALVTQLQAAAAAAAADELAKAAAYTAAKNALDAATARAQSLDAQAQAAQTAAASAKKRYGQFVSQLYTSGGSDVTTQLILSGSSKTSNLLKKLSAMSQLSDHSSQLQAAAEQKQNIAQSTAKQAENAKTIRDQLAAEAQTKLQAAQAAQQAADAELAKQQSVSQTLYAQAASLKNTATSVQEQYYVGVQARETHNGGSSGDTAYIDTAGVVVDPAAAQAYARSRLSAYGWGDDQFGCLVDLWNHESGWRANAYNESSGAYGIPQAWPGSKLATAGADWRTNAATQINWGLGYIDSSYGSPCAAWHFEMSHDPNWY